MSKRFYIVVPYEPGSGGKRSFFDQLSEIMSPTKVIKLSKEKFADYKNELERRVALVESGLQGMSLNTARLDTQSLIESLYNTYNPNISEFEKVTDINKLKLAE